MKLKIQRVLMAKCVRNGHQISFRKKKVRTYSPDRSGNPYGARGLRPPPRKIAAKSRTDAERIPMGEAPQNSAINVVNLPRETFP